MTKPFLYFAHPYRMRNTPLESKIRDLLAVNYEILDPFIGEVELEEKYGGRYYEKTSYAFADDVVRCDYKLFRKAHEFFGWFIDGEPMIGTTVELMWSLHEGKPIIVLSEKLHPFLLVYSDFFFLTIEDLREWKPLDKKTFTRGEKHE